MVLVTRILVALSGLECLLIAGLVWFGTTYAGGLMGVAANGLVGGATMRANIGGLFLSIAVFSLVAAWRTNRTWLLGALIVTMGALSGRIISLAIDGYGPGLMLPMLVEAAKIALLLWARKVWAEPTVDQARHQLV